MYTKHVCSVLSEHYLMNSSITQNWHCNTTERCVNACCLVAGCVVRARDLPSALLKQVSALSVGNCVYASVYFCSMRISYAACTELRAR